MDSTDVIIIGAGVVGLACASSLARAGREVLVIEAETAFGTGISSRNSEVIHAGLYYPPGSLKARLCVEGRHKLYNWCTEHAVPHARCGKLIVATHPDQAPALDAIAERARTNGVPELQTIDTAQLRELEPELAGHSALLSPNTGIVDSHSLMLSLLGDAERHGAMLALASPVLGGQATDDGIILHISDHEAQLLAPRTSPLPGTGRSNPEGNHAPASLLPHDTPTQRQGHPPPTSTTLKARWVINAAGLDAPLLGRQIRSAATAQAPQPHYARGIYFSHTGKTPFSRLIYPIPEAGGLGVHLTLDLGGQAKFGPDVEWIDHPDYTVNPARKERFVQAIQRWWPQLDPNRLQPGYAGIRPKIVGPGQPDADFRIDGPTAHGVPGLIHLYGIESPGLTASLAIAEHVASLVNH
ncbi:MAG: NAD(P)/FAD-dependent oxidoreductase [Lautropia sp.]|nr:NAD(P)/FAD-dependent oxidoreductase [Lautropia sp.]